MIKKKAFTIIEMLLVVALFTLMSAITIPFYQSMQISTQRETVKNELIANLHRAKLKAIATVDDDSWGINIGADNQIIMFKGSNFETRDTIYDETIAVPTNIAVGKETGNITQIIFNKFSGLPSVSGIITLKDVTGQSQDITITQQGTVDY